MDIKNDIKNSGFEDIGFAKIDTDRKRRQGTAEVIFGEGKTAEQIQAIVEKMIKSGQKRILITRLDNEKASKIDDIKYFDTAKIGVIGDFCKKNATRTDAASDDHTNDDDTKNVKDIKAKNIAVCCAGTSDLPVAEEAALTLEFLGQNVSRFYDVGVSGLHRLFAYLDELQKASVIICVAGMEGALPSVIGGLVSCPVIAVPTSVGYGASFSGLSALLGMLNSCASGVTVVNIDNGFGAAMAANRIMMTNKNEKFIFEKFIFDGSNGATSSKILEQLEKFAKSEEIYSEKICSKQNIEQENFLEDKNSVSHGHSLQEIHEIIDRTNIKESVKEDAKGIFEILTECECKFHQKTPDTIHFHEIGRKENVLKICKICNLVEELGITDFSYTPLNLGFGKIECSHGILDIPAPATSLIIQDMDTFKNDTGGELTTPSGAAIIKYFATKLGKN